VLGQTIALRDELYARVRVLATNAARRRRSCWACRDIASAKVAW